MNTSRPLLLILLVIFFSSSCRDEESPATLTAALSASECAGSTGNIFLTITTRGSWQVTTSDAWLLPDLNKGIGDAVVNVIVSVNRGTGERSAVITVKGDKSTETFTITQQAGVFSVTPEAIVFPEVAVPLTVTIASTRAWKIRNAVDAPWCHFSETSGVGNAVITLTPDPLVDKSISRGPVEIVVESGSATRRFSLKHEFPVSYHEDGAVVVYHQGTVTNPVKIAVLGDGFIRDDYKHGGAFDQAVNKMMDGFFNAEPFKTYKEYFTVYKVIAYSNERGATVEKDVTTGGKPPKQTRDTRFKSVLRGGGSAHVSGDDNEVIAWARKVPGINLDKSGIFLLVNIDVWSGVTTSWARGQFIARTCYDANFVGRMLHEGGGHGFGRLKDEYIDYATTIADSTKNAITERQANGWWQYAGNVDLTGSLTSVHWKHYFSITGYSRVNLFEGCCLYRLGAWRAESLSIMEKSSYIYFNAPSREAIVRRVFERAGETFLFDNFIARDVNVLPSTTASRGPLLPETLVPPVEL